MFHLLNKTYLDYDFMFNVTHDFVAIGPRWTNVIFSREDGQNLGVADNLEMLLSNQFEGDIDNFWQMLVERQTRTHVFVNQQLHTKLQIQFWKSIFKNPTNDSLYLLYRLYIQNKRMRRFIYREFITNENRFSHEQLNILSQTEFDQLVKTVQPSTYLATIDKGILGFEYLMAHYLATRHYKRPRYHGLFLERYEELFWMTWTGENERDRERVLMALFEVNEQFPYANIDLNINNVDKIEELFEGNEWLGWVFDREFTTKDIPYVRETVDIVKHAKIIRDIWPVGAQQMGADLGFESSEYIQAIVDNDYARMFQMEIDKGMGTMISQARFARKMNQLFISRIIERFRENEIVSLRPFILK